MFDQDFGAYKTRIEEYVKYSYHGRELIIFLLWEIIEILWFIGKHLTHHSSGTEKPVR